MKKSSAEKKFTVGQRVRLSPSGRRLLLPYSKKMKATSRGKVIAYSGPLGVKVHVDGYANPTAFHIDFWEPVRHDDIGDRSE